MPHEHPDTIAMQLTDAPDDRELFELVQEIEQLIELDEPNLSELLAVGKRAQRLSDRIALAWWKHSENAGSVALRWNLADSIVRLANDLRLVDGHNLETLLNEYDDITTRLTYGASPSEQQIIRTDTASQQVRDLDISIREENHKEVGYVVAAVSMVVVVLALVATGNMGTTGSGGVPISAIIMFVGMPMYLVGKKLSSDRLFRSNRSAPLFHKTPTTQSRCRGYLAYLAEISPVTTETEGAFARAFAPEDISYEERIARFQCAQREAERGFEFLLTVKPPSIAESAHNVRLTYAEAATRFFSILLISDPSADEYKTMNDLSTRVNASIDDLDSFCLNAD